MTEAVILSSTAWACGSSCSFTLFSCPGTCGVVGTSPGICSEDCRAHSDARRGVISSLTHCAPFGLLAQGKPSSKRATLPFELDYESYPRSFGTYRTPFPP